jgi:hypothetical protein
MPIPNIMKTVLVHTSYFALLRQPIRNKVRAPSFVARSWPSGLLNSDLVSGELRKQLPASLGNSWSRLATVLK